MNRAAFFEAADELVNWVANLSYTTECALRDAEDRLCRKQEQCDVEAFVRWDLAAIDQMTEQVMAAFDRLCQAAGRQPRFELAFRVLEAARLEGMPPAPPQPSPR